jgi:hypothetical protein
MRPDPLIMSADIARVSAERPEMGDELVRALYQHLLLIEGRQPAVHELREYVDRVSCLDEDVLRQQLGLGPRLRDDRTPTTMRRRGRVTTPMDAALADGDRPGVARRPGRPAWTAELFAARYQAALQRATPPHTYQSIADQFEMLDGSVGTDPDHLRKLIRRYGLTPV